MFSLKLKGRSLSITKLSFMNRKTIDSRRISSDSSLPSDSSSMLSSETLVAPLPKRSRGGRPPLPDYAEMLEDENMSWGLPKSHRR